MNRNSSYSKWIVLLGTLAPIMGMSKVRTLSPSQNMAQHSQLKPLARIYLSPLGYLQPATMPALGGASLVTLAFIDSNHFLFSFDIPAPATKGTDSCASEGTGRWVRTLVLNIASGKVEKAAQWELFDYAPFLLSLQNGQFILRRCSQISIFRADLNPRPLVNVEHSVQLFNVSPDGSHVLLESQHSPSQSKAELEPIARNLFPVDLDFLYVNPLNVLGRSHAPTLENLPLFDTGFLTLQQTSHDLWKVNLQPYPGIAKGQAAQVLTKIYSTCTPHMEAITRHTFLALVCLDGVTYWAEMNKTYDLTGHLLWRKPVGQSHLTVRYASIHAAHIASSADQSKIAIAALLTSYRPATASAPIAISSMLKPQLQEKTSNSPLIMDEHDIDGQAIDVFESRTGNQIFHFITSPIYSAGQNFALSPHGNRLAVLHDDAIEIYALHDSPEISHKSQP